MYSFKFPDQLLDMTNQFSDAKHTVRICVHCNDESNGRIKFENEFLLGSL